MVDAPDDVVVGTLAGFDLTRHSTPIGRGGRSVVSPLFATIVLAPAHRLLTSGSWRLSDLTMFQLPARSFLALCLRARRDVDGGAIA